MFLFSLPSALFLSISRLPVKITLIDCTYNSNRKGIHVIFLSPHPDPLSPRTAITIQTNFFRGVLYEHSNKWLHLGMLWMLEEPGGVSLWGSPRCSPLPQWTTLFHRPKNAEMYRASRPSAFCVSGPRVLSVVSRPPASASSGNLLKMKILGLPWWRSGWESAC